MSSTTLPACPKTGSTSPSLTVHLCLHTAPGNRECARDELLVLGFPVGFYEGVKNWPTVRHGLVAQIQPYLTGTARTFLIDGSVFGGNSGGPVVTDTTTQRPTNSLIGMVSGCRLDPSNGQNADLGVVVPLDTINETIEMAFSDSPHVSRAARGD